MLPKNTPSVGRLYRLVAGMTAPQKRAFRRDANYWKDQRSEMKYFKLFEETNLYINKGGQETGFFAYLLSTQKALATRKEISALAGYLFERILTSMRFIPERSAEFILLNGLIQDAYFLYNKSLWADCLYIIKTAIDLALRLDRPAYITELCLLERRVLLRFSGIEKKEIRLAELQAREQHALVQLQLFNDFFNTAEIFRGAINQQQELPEELLDKTLQYISGYNDNGGEIYNTVLGLRSRLQALNLFSNYYRYKQLFHAENDTIDYPLRAFETTKTIIKLLKVNRELLDEMPTYYSLVESFMIRCLHTLNFSELEPHLAELENNPDELIRYRTGKFFRLQTYLIKGDFVAAKKHIEQHDLSKHWKRLADNIWSSRLVTAYYSGMMTYLILLDYNESLRWSGMTQEAVKDQTMNDYLLSAKMVQLICLDNLNSETDLLLLIGDYKKEKHPTDPEFIYSLLTLLQSHFSGQLKVKDRQTLQSLEQTLIKNRKMVHYSYILAWLNAQFNDITPTEAMRKFG